MIFVNEHLMFMNERLNMIGIVPRCIPCLYCTCHDRLFLCNWWLSNLVTRVNMDILYTLYSVCMYIYLIQGRDSCRIYANLIIKTIYYWQYGDLIRKGRCKGRSTLLRRNASCHVRRTSVSYIRYGLGRICLSSHVVSNIFLPIQHSMNALLIVFNFGIGSSLG